MKFALAQLNSGSDWRKNLAAVCRLIRTAAQKHHDAILFPENTLYMGPPKHLRRIGREIRPHAIPVLKAAAKVHNVAILLGSYPEIQPNTRKVWNTSVFIDERGRILGRYRKIHLFDVKTPHGKTFAESKFIAAGRRAKTFKWRDLHFGMSVCFDLRFPEFYRKLSSKGAEIILAPSAFTAETGIVHWRTLLRARAIENLATILAPAQVGTHPDKRKTYGHSLAIDPWGEILRDAGARIGLTSVSVSADRSRRLRKLFPVLLRSA